MFTGIMGMLLQWREGPLRLLGIVVGLVLIIVGGLVILGGVVTFCVMLYEMLSKRKGKFLKSRRKVGFLKSIADSSCKCNKW
jgi:hypothetical protein